MTDVVHEKKMINAIQNVADFLNVPEASKDKLFNELVSFSVSAEITELYDTIRGYERKGMSRKEIKATLQEGQLDQLRIDTILQEYNAIQKVLYRHRGKQRFIRGCPVLLFGLAGFYATFAFRNTLGLALLASICIVSFVSIIIAIDATIGGLFQMATGWN